MSCLDDLQHAPLLKQPHPGITEVRWMVAAPNVARLLDVDTGQMPRHQPASIIISIESNDFTSPVITLAIQLGHQQREIERITTASIESNLIDGLSHIDVCDQDGLRLLALTLDADDRCLYAQTSIMDKLGLPGGRYDAASVTRQTIADVGAA